VVVPVDGPALADPDQRRQSILADGARFRGNVSAPEAKAL
jgi:hypothetical protein